MQNILIVLYKPTSLPLYPSCSVVPGVGNVQELVLDGQGLQLEVEGGQGLPRNLTVQAQILNKEVNLVRGV